LLPDLGGLERFVCGSRLEQLVARIRLKQFVARTCRKQFIVPNVEKSFCKKSGREKSFCLLPDKRLPFSPAYEREAETFFLVACGECPERDHKKTHAMVMSNGYRRRRAAAWRRELPPPRQLIKNWLATR
jgi:hypothetical protein